MTTTSLAASVLRSLAATAICLSLLWGPSLLHSHDDQDSPEAPTEIPTPVVAADGDAEG